jgi:hypothetical protein
MHFFTPEMGKSINWWYHQKVILKSFPMNGHVSMFRHTFNYFTNIISWPWWLPSVLKGLNGIKQHIVDSVPKSWCSTYKLLIYQSLCRWMVKMMVSLQYTIFKMYGKLNTCLIQFCHKLSSCTYSAFHSAPLTRPLLPCRNPLRFHLGSHA